MKPLQTRANELSESLRAVAVQRGGSTLSRREEEIAGLVERGLTNRRIAELLHLSERTAENRVEHILTKLGLQNRSQVATWVAHRPA
jgi:DNA-binding NarL/FixJ family response regulator